MSEILPPVLPETTPPQKPGVTLESLQHKALELMKNPVVAAGGTVLVGLVIARVAAGSKLRQVAFKAVTDYLKVKTVSTILQPTPPQVAPTVGEPAANPVTPAADPHSLAGLGQLGKQLLEKAAPQLMELAKNKLAQIFPNQH
jgi:hypothetical protein